MGAKPVLIAAAAVVGAIALGLPGINIVVDPFQVFGTPGIPGVNVERTAASTRARLSKALTVCRKQPDLVILGASRAEFIFDPAHQGLAAISARPYSYAMAGTGVHEIRRSIEHAYYGAGTKTAIVTLDFHMFNVYREEVIYRTIIGDYDEGNLVLSPSNSCLRVFARLADFLTFSGATLRMSIETVRAQGGPNTAVYLDNGLRASGFMDKAYLYMNGPQAPGLLGQAKAYMEQNVWLVAPERRFCLESSSRSTIDEFRQIVAFARKHGMQIYFVLTPEHAYLQMAIWRLGLWPQYTRWRAELVEALAADQAAHPGQPPFPLWDFATLNSVTAEPAPPPNAPAIQQHMKWWYESTHSQPRTGALILDRILGRDSVDAKENPDFGTRLDRSNIEQHTDRLRTDMERYIAEHPDDIAKIHEVARNMPPFADASEYCRDPKRTAAAPVPGIELAASPPR